MSEEMEEGSRRPIPQYDINNDENYEADELEFEKDRKRKREPENTRETACYLCDHGKNWKENFIPKKFAIIDSTIIDSLNKNASDFFKEMILESRGFEMLANMFNECVVDNQKAIDSDDDDRVEDTEICSMFRNLNTATDETVVPFKRVGPEAMERHYLSCFDSPIVHQYKLKLQYKKYSYEIHSTEMITYRHVSKTNTKKGSVKKLNSYALRDAMNIDNFITRIDHTLDRMIKNTPGCIYELKKSDKNNVK